MDRPVMNADQRATSSTGGDIDCEDLLNRIANDLAGTFQGVFSPETVCAYVTKAYEQARVEARIHTFLPILTEGISPART